MKKVVIIFTLIAVIILIGLVIVVLSNSAVHPNEIYIKEVNVSDSNVSLKGTFLGSAIKFKGYRVKYTDQALYFKIKGGLISFKKNKEIDISFVNKYGEIKQIYLQGDDPSENILIWPKE